MLAGEPNVALQLPFLQQSEQPNSRPIVLSDFRAMSPPQPDYKAAAHGPDLADDVIPGGAHEASAIADLTGSGAPLRMAGLFAGIGGIELGMAASGHSADLLCEIDDAAYAVLRRRFPADIPLIRDVRDIDRLPPVDLIAAGFPCQDLSQAGRTAGITGERSGLVGQVLRLVEDCASARWLLLENVPFMLQLDRGEAMRFLTTSLDALGFQWAYRIVDTRAFGLPQRRQRVLLLASRDVDPKEILFPDDAGVPAPEDPTDVACGFYWTEGVRGLGWAVNAVPTLKGGSTIGIPSPPAIWTAEGDFVLPEIRDVERLQGFPADWTAPAVRDERRRSSGPRWKLVGNAVSVPVAEWLGHCLLDPRPYDSADDVPLERGDKWPTAAWGTGGEAWRADVSPWPKHQTRAPLSEFLEYPTTSLSARATAGFLSRARRGNLRFPDEFLDDLERHLARVSTVTPVG